MDYKKDLIELVDKYYQLSQSLEEAKNRWQQADAGSEEEKEAARDRGFISSQISTLSEDIIYLKKKVFTTEDWGAMVNYIQLGGTLIGMNFQNLQLVANDLKYSYRSFSEQNRITFIFDREVEDDGLPLQVAVHFVIEDIFLRSFVCPTEYEVKEEELRIQILNEINAYNEETRIMKAYIDKDGSVCLERQDIIDRGVTKETLHKTMDLVFRSMVDFYKNRSESYLKFIKSK